VHIGVGGCRVLTSERAMTATGVNKVRAHLVPTYCFSSHLLRSHSGHSPDVVPAHPLLCMVPYMRAGIYSRLTHQHAYPGEEKDNEGDSRGCEFFD
jgi:hypothetical protein